jgi:hypothetical protein
MFGKAWELGKESVTSFINDGALSRGAAIAFYTVTSIGPFCSSLSPLLASPSARTPPEEQSSAQRAHGTGERGAAAKRHQERLRKALRYLRQRLGSHHTSDDGLGRVRRNAVDPERHLEGGPEGRSPACFALAPPA